MAARGEAHYAYLLDAEFIGVAAGIFEGVMDVLEGSVPGAVGHSVLEDSDGHALLDEPVCGIDALVVSGDQGIGAAGADDDHLAVGLLRLIDVHPGIVGNVGDGTGLVNGFGAGGGSGILHGRGHRLDLLRYDGIVLDRRGGGLGILGIEEDRPVGTQVDVRLGQEGERHRRKCGDSQQQSFGIHNSIVYFPRR